MMNGNDILIFTYTVIFVMMCSIVFGIWLGKLTIC